MLANKFKSVVATVITLLFLFVVLVSFRGAHLNEIAARVFVLTLYVLLAVSYIMRGALFFLGIFAVYQLIREQVNVRLATQ